MRIPSDVAVGLSVYAVTFTVPDSVFQTVAGTFFTLLCCRVNGGAVTGESKAFKVDQSHFSRAVQEKGTENFKKSGTCIHVGRRFLFEFFKEFFHSDFFDRRSFFFFTFWFLLIIPISGRVSISIIIIKVVSVRVLC